MTRPTHEGQEGGEVPVKNLCAIARLLAICRRGLFDFRRLLLLLLLFRFVFAGVMRILVTTIHTLAALLALLPLQFLLGALLPRLLLFLGLLGLLLHRGALLALDELLLQVPRYKHVLLGVLLVLLHSADHNHHHIG